MSAKPSNPITSTTNRYTLNVLKRIGDVVLEWSIVDTDSNKTVAQGDAMGYASACELVRRANASGATL